MEPAGEPESPADEPAAGIRVLSGNPTSAELAAIVAVLTAQAEESAADEALPQPGHRSAWDRGRIAIRREVVPGIGAWRAFP